MFAFWDSPESKAHWRGAATQAQMLRKKFSHSLASLKEHFMATGALSAASSSGSRKSSITTGTAEVLLVHQDLHSGLPNNTLKLHHAKQSYSGLYLWYWANKIKKKPFCSNKKYNWNHVNSPAGWVSAPLQISECFPSPPALTNNFDTRLPLN